MGLIHPRTVVTEIERVVLEQQMESIHTPWEITSLCGGGSFCPSLEEEEPIDMSIEI